MNDEHHEDGEEYKNLIKVAIERGPPSSEPAVTSYQNVTGKKNEKGNKEEETQGR